MNRRVIILCQDNFNIYASSYGSIAHAIIDQYILITRLCFTNFNLITLDSVRLFSLLLKLEKAKAYSKNIPLMTMQIISF